MERKSVYAQSDSADFSQKRYTKAPIFIAYLCLGN